MTRQESDRAVRYEERDALTSESYKEWIGSVQIYWTFWGARRGAG